MGNVISLFCGCGGIDLACKQAGCEIVFAADNNKFACKLYNANFTLPAVCADVRDLDPNTIPDCDLIVGGFPCQPFTQAGERQGFADPRGTLFREIIRFAEAKKPKAMLLENVQGLITLNACSEFIAIMQGIKDLGYHAVYSVLDAKDYGTCQTRKRIYICVFREQQEAVRFYFPPKTGQTTIDDILKRHIRVADKYYYTSGIYFNKLSDIIGDVHNADKDKMYKFRQGEGVRVHSKNICPTLMAQMGTGGA